MFVGINFDPASRRSSLSTPPPFRRGGKESTMPHSYLKTPSAPVREISPFTLYLYPDMTLAVFSTSLHLYPRTLTFVLSPLGKIESKFSYSKELNRGYMVLMYRLFIEL
jgi:hypothetical protein